MMNQTTELQVKNLQRGMELVVGDKSETKKVASVTNGFYIGSKIITFWDGDWTCIMSSSVVDIKNQ